MRHRVLALAVLALASPALGEDGFEHGRIRYLEGAVTLQRASEAGAEEAIPNLPFLPGDRIWTDETGRAEFQFADGVVRLDARSKLDYVAHEEARRGGRIVLRLWSGGLYLRAGGGGEDRASSAFEIETPGAVVEVRDRGVYRVDVASGETRLSVYEGEATVESGRRRVRVEEGERTYALRGETPEAPQPFDRGEADEFARWDEDRERREAWAGSSLRYLPEEVTPYASELEAHGSWYYESEVGYVWRPYVAAGWRPYLHGRWCWTPYGWTWVPYEPWGWAPFHYGRWGFSPTIGWYWIPGRAWGPGWVVWAVGADYVGWCPLGHRDGPAILHQSRSRGRAVPRGTQIPASSPWTYVRRTDLEARDLAQRRVEVSEPQAGGLRVLDTLRARLGRDLHVAEGEAVPRNIKTRPTVGDTVPELRGDPMTTIPLPTPRRRRTEAEEPARRAPREAAPRGHREAVGQLGRPEAEPVAPRARPTDSRSPEARPRPEREVAPRAVRPAEPDRELLRPFFESLGRPPRREGSGEGAGARPRGRDEGASRPERQRPESAAPRHEPRLVHPRPAEPPPRAEPKPVAPRAETARPRKEKEP